MTDNHTQHHDAARALRHQKQSTGIFSVLLTAGLGLLGWISLQLFEMNGTMRSLETEVTRALKTQQAQEQSISENERRIGKNARQIKENETRIQRNRKNLEALEDAGQ